MEKFHTPNDSECYKALSEPFTFYKNPNDPKYELHNYPLLKADTVS
jgi:hypothetical protein